MVAGLRDVRGRSTVIITTAVITLLFLPLTVSTNNNNALLQSQSVFAQQQEETAFLPYQSPIHGIFIQYPSDWTASTSGLTDYTDLIAFYSPLQNISDSSPTRLKISVITYGQNISLSEYTDLVWTRLNQSEQVDVRSSSSEATVAGYPGYSMVLADQPFQNSTLTFYHMNTWTTIGNRVYLLTYEGEEYTFNQHLPEVSRMMESLSISINNVTTTADREVEAGNQTQQEEGDGGLLGGIFGGDQQGGGNQSGGGPPAPFTEPFQDLFG